MIGIYKITNTITNQCYIGQSIDIESRWKEHINKGKNLYVKTKFYLALNKYGTDAFEFEVLEECPLDQKVLDERERYWINYYDSYNNGYNSTLGGQSEISWKYDPQIIHDLWDEGYSTKEIAEIVGCGTTLVQNRLKGYSDYNTHTGHSRGKQHVLAESKFQIGLPPIIVYQYNLNGQYITEHESIHSAVRKLGYDTPGAESVIRAALRHETKTAYGYQWSTEKVESMPIVPLPNGKLIRCINTNQIFHSISAAATWCNLKSSSGIGKCCAGQRKTAGNHPQTGEKLKWEYVEI